jgi:hypothetical protein
VQKADSLSPFDELDAALQSGPSKGRAAVLRRATGLSPSEADCLRARGNQTVSLLAPAFAGRNSRNMTLQRRLGVSAR